MTSHAATKALVHPFGETARHPLRAVSGASRARRPRTTYALIGVLGVVAILIAQLLISIGLSDGAYELSSIQSEQKQVSREKAMLQEKLRVLDSPQNLAANAEALGMVKGGSPVYLDQQNATIQGSPQAASAEQGVIVGRAGDMVKNKLLDGVPLGVDKTKDAQGNTPSDDAAGVASAAGTGANVASDPALTAPQTH